MRIAAEVKDFDPAGLAHPKELRRLDRNVVLALGAAKEALADAGLNGFDPHRVGIVFGSAIGGLIGIVEQADTLRDRGPDRISPYFIPNVLVDSASGQLAISLGHPRAELRAGLGLRDRLARGGRGRRDDPPRRRRRDPRRRHRGLHPPADPRRLHARCAGSPPRTRTRRAPRGRSTRPAPASSWARGPARSCSRSSSRPAPAARRIYAEVLGYGASNDAYHMAAPEPEAVGVAEMMRAALERAEVDQQRVGYINAHGTSTPLGDAAETKAIKDVFGDHAYELAVSSTKSVMGHCFGAAGAIEAMMCVLAIRDGVLPPTINYENPDPDCDLDYVPNESREAEVDVALSNAMGLGGHNACVLVGRAPA